LAESAASFIYPGERQFFCSGGDPVLADHLFAEIAQAFGRHLPPVLIYSAPDDPISRCSAGAVRSTGSSAAVIVASRTDTPQFHRPWSGRYCVDLYQLVEKIETTHPVYECRRGESTA